MRLRYAFNFTTSSTPDYVHRTLSALFHHSSLAPYLACIANPCAVTILFYGFSDLTVEKLFGRSFQCAIVH